MPAGQSRITSLIRGQEIRHRIRSCVNHWRTEFWRHSQYIAAVITQYGKLRISADEICHAGIRTGDIGIVARGIKSHNRIGQRDDAGVAVKAAAVSTRDRRIAANGAVVQDTCGIERENPASKTKVSRITLQSTVIEHHLITVDYAATIAVVCGIGGKRAIAGHQRVEIRNSATGTADVDGIV